MKKRLTAIVAATMAVCGFGKLYSQQAMGLIAGNHNAPYSAFQNPANTYSDRNRVYINVWGTQIGFTNNYLTYNAPFGLVRMANGDYPDAYTNASGSLNFDQNWLPWENTAREKLYYLDEVYGPSISFRTSRRTAIGFGMRAINGLSLDGIGPEAGRLLRYGMDTSGQTFAGPYALQQNTTYHTNAFSINADRYQEWYFSLAGVTRDNGPNFMKWGATGKFLLGMGAAGIQSTGADFGVDSNYRFNINNSKTSFYHTNGSSSNSVLASPLGFKFNEVQGLGAGLDLGFVYEYRPDAMRKKVTDWWTCLDEQRNDYAWKFGASISDLGFIAYDGSRRDMNTNQARSWNINTNVLNNNTFQNDHDHFQRIDTGFFDQPGIQAEANDRFVTTTPATLNAQLDVNLKNNFYVGLNWQQNLKKVNSMGIKKSSYISAVPRWEGEHAEIGVPITLTRDYSDLNVGLYGRLGPVIIGTDNLAGLAKYVANNDYKSANVYFAVRFQIAACGWSRYHYYEADSVKADTVVQTDTTNFWERDTVVKKDTIFKERIVRDTVRIQKHDTIVQYRNLEATNGDASARDLELRRKEADLKKREEELKKREALVVQKENQNGDMGVGTDCSRRIAELEDQLKRERELYAKLNGQYQDCKDERERAKLRIAELEKDLAKTKADYKVTADENTGLKLEIDRLRAEISRLKAGNRPCDAQMKTLDSLLALEQGKNIELQKENSKQKAEVSGVKKDNDDQKKRIAELEAEIARLKATCTDKAACDKAIKDLQDQLAAEKTKSAGLQKDLDDTRAKYQVALQKTKDLEEQLKNCGNTEELARLKAELEAQKKKCDELDIRVKTLESEKAALTNENSTLKAKVTGLEKDLADTKAKLDAESKKAADLTEQLKNCGDAEELARLKAEIDGLKKSGSEKDAQITALKNDKAKLQADLTDANAKITDLESQLKECKAKDCSELEAQVADYKDKYESTKNSLNALNLEYNALLAERNDLKKKLSDCQDQLKNCSGSSEEIVSLRAEIATLKVTIGALKSDITAMQNSLDDLQESYDKLAGEKSTLEKQVTSLQSQITALNKQVAELEAKLKACQEGSSGGGGN